MHCKHGQIWSVCKACWKSFQTRLCDFSNSLWTSSARVLKNLIRVDFDEYRTDSEYIFFRMWVLNAWPRKVHLILWAAIVILSCLKLILKSLDGLWSLQFEIGIFYLHLLLLLFSSCTLPNSMDNIGKEKKI